MDIVKNKWLNLLIMFFVIFIAVIAAVSVLSFKRNKNGVLKATLDISNATVTASPSNQPSTPNGPGQ